MWTHRFETRTDLPPESIWPLIADIARWPELDHNIEALEIDQPPASGTPFMLKPRGGPRLRFTVGHFEPPSRYSDICRLPLARMETVHALHADRGTRLEVEIRISGPLARLWGLLVGRQHAKGLPAQTARILDAAKRRSAA